MTSAADRSVPPEVSALFAADREESREAAWQAFLDRYSLLIRHTAAKLGSGYDLTMDRYAFVLEQLRADDFRRLRKFQAGGSARFSTWLVVVVRRLCLDHHRRLYGRSASSEPTARRANELRYQRRQLADLVTDTDDVGGIADADRLSITTEFSVRERGQVLGRVVGDLEPSDRLLLQLRFEEALPAREIAQRMGLDSQSQVYRRLDALLSSLRSQLRGAGFENAA
jgi:RNA polymerase sigma factor (sigma-70 family)